MHPPKARQVCATSPEMCSGRDHMYSGVDLDFDVKSDI